MSKRDTFRSFRDLDPSRFRKEERGPSDSPDAVPPGSDGADGEAAPEDETAMFLDAVAGNIDISGKNTPLEPDAPQFRGRKAEKNHPVLRNGENAAPEPLPPRGQSPVPPDRRPPASEEERLFAEAMGGVRPIQARGREITPSAKAGSAVAARLADMDDIFPGKLEFSLEYTDEYVQGHVLGLDPVVLGKLKAGAYSPEGHVDLHGQNMEQAYATLTAFIRLAYQNGKRHVLVITGRGRNSPGGTPVLRERVQAWFTREPFKRVILGFCSAKPGDGGAGALYVLLRRRKKSQGKIVWNTVPTEEDLLV